MEEIVFDERNVELNVEANNWEEAIRKGVKILQKNGYVKDIYSEKIIQNVKELGSYIVISPGIAIPHARPEDGVIDVGYSLITLKKPVYFPGMDVPVKVLISFSAIDNNTHLELIKAIVNIIQTKLINKIAKVEKIDDLKKLLRNHHIT